MSQFVRALPTAPIHSVGAEEAPGSGLPTITPTMRVLGVVGAASGAYHGYKRNNSVGWAIGWALLGGIFPIVTVPVSLAQGFGKRKK